MFNKMILRLVISYIIKALAKFGTTTDWDLVKADAANRVAALLPGTWFDAEAIAICNAVIDAVANVLTKSAGWQKVLDAVAAQDWPAAMNAVKELLTSVWSVDTTDVAQVNAHAGLVALDLLG